MEEPEKGRIMKNKLTMQWVLIIQMVITLFMVSTASGASVISNTGGGGLWTNALLWSTEYMPGTSDSADNAFIRNGAVMTIDTTVPLFTDLHIGQTSSAGTVVVTTNGNLTVKGLFSVGRVNETGNSGTLVINGGTVTASNTSSLITIGSGGITGIVSVSSGTINAKVTLGAVSGDSGDKLNIAGSAAINGLITANSGSIVEISGSGSTVFGTDFTVNSGALLHFTFDAAGIRKMQCSGAVGFSASSLVVIDGTAYAGQDATFDLLNAGTLGTNIPSITLTNFYAGTTYNYSTATGILSVNVKTPFVKKLKLSIIR